MLVSVWVSLCIFDLEFCSTAVSGLCLSVSLLFPLASPPVCNSLSPPSLSTPSLTLFWVSVSATASVLGAGNRR